MVIIGPSIFESHQPCDNGSPVLSEETAVLLARDAIFDQPQRLRWISLVFEENETARTQEFVLQWSPDGGRSVKEIVRQQWNFSPPETVREVEEYQVELSGVTVLELAITPDIAGGAAHVSLKNFRLS